MVLGWVPKVKVGLWQAISLLITWWVLSLELLPGRERGYVMLASPSVLDLVRAFQQMHTWIYCFPPVNETPAPKALCRVGFTYDWP